MSVLRDGRTSTAASPAAPLPAGVAAFSASASGAAFRSCSIRRIDPDLEIHLASTTPPRFPRRCSKGVHLTWSGRTLVPSADWFPLASRARPPQTLHLRPSLTSHQSPSSPLVAPHGIVSGICRTASDNIPNSAFFTSSAGFLLSSLRLSC